MQTHNIKRRNVRDTKIKKKLIINAVRKIQISTNIDFTLFFSAKLKLFRPRRCNKYVTIIDNQQTVEYIQQ